MAEDGVVWRCPSCSKQVKADTDVALYWALRRHILEHEDRAALQAVDRMKARCYSPSCPLVGNHFIIRGLDGLPILTDFDKQWLRGIKINW
jgi:hypothetical protein